MDHVVALACVRGLPMASARHSGPEKQIDNVLLTLVHQGGYGSVLQVIKTPSKQRKTLCRHILDWRGEWEFALKPRFDRVLVRRSDIGEMVGHQRACVSRDDLLREDIFWGWTDRDESHTPDEEYARGQRGTDPQPRPGPDTGVCIGPARPAHGRPNALL